MKTKVITDDGKQSIAVTIQQNTDQSYYLGRKGLTPSGVYVRNATSAAPATEAASYGHAHKTGKEQIMDFILGQPDT